MLKRAFYYLVRPLLHTPGCHVPMYLMAAVVAMAQSATADTITVDVRDFEDGLDYLILQGSNVQWQHFDFSVPGYNGDPTSIITTLDGNTILDNYPWYPTWPNGTASGAYSSQFSGLTPVLPSGQLTSFTMTVIEARYEMNLIQTPDATNGYTTIVEFDDDPIGGADYYEVLLTYQTGLSTAFTANPTNGVVPLTVNFTSAGVDSDSNAITSWNWNFGDGSTSTAQNPSHTYTAYGTFFPTLIATNNLGYAVIVFGPSSITVSPPTVALTNAFSANPTNGVLPLRVNFTSADVDSAGNALTNWNWNFGDGSTSTAQYPAHTYTHSGTFSPTFIATDNLGNAVIGAGPASITVSPPTVAFTANPTNGVAPLRVNFTSAGVDSAGNAITSWNWDFGDGSTNTAQNPSHTYTTNGTFSPALIATNNLGYSVICTGPASITVSIPTVAFTANPTNGVVPLTVSFTSPSIDSGGSAITSWTWSFSDGSTNTTQNPFHTYIIPGTFFPALIVSNNIGLTITGSGPASITVPPFPVAFSPNPTNARFFRISGPTATIITAFNPDGTLVWSNAQPGASYTVQAAASLADGTNWVDYVQIAATNDVNTNQLIGFNPPAGMSLIPAGSFTMGDTLDGETDAVPISVTVSAIYMDTNLVSYSQWQSVYSYATSHGYRFDDAGSGKAEHHPVQSVDWYDVVKWSNARSQQAGLTPVYYTDAGLTQVYTTGDVDAVYANWSANGYRLPTEAEWEKAARGGWSGLRFPFGDTISESQANYDGGGNGYDLGPAGFNAAFDHGGVPYTSPVGYFAPNGYGLYDMAGNVAEWCWDWYGTPYGQPTTTNPTGPASGSARVLRGGTWQDIAEAARCAARGGDFDPSWVYNKIGFRCVRGL
jgi:PKD repeat protein